MLKRTRLLIPFILATIAGGMPMGRASGLTLDPNHPRMFFYRVSLDAVRSRAIGGSNSAIFQRLKEYADTRPVTIQYMHYFAAVYLITQDTSYADKAISLAMQAVAQDQGGYTRSEGISWGQLSPVVLVYDWCYDRLTETQRQQIQDRFAWSFSYRSNSYHQKFNEYHWGYQYATAGEGARGAEALAGLEAMVDYLQNSVLPCYDSLMPMGAQDGYYGKYASKIVQFVDCLKHSGGIDETDRTHVQNLASFWAAAQRPDGLTRRMLQKFNSTSVRPNLFWAWAGSRLGDRDAQAMVNRRIASQDFDQDDAIWLLAWYDPSLPASSLSTVPLDWFDPGYNWYLGRTGWTIGAGSSDHVALFSAQPFVGEQRATGHWEIMRGPDDLICKNAHFYGDQDLHFSPWLQQTHAFNTVLIYDPAEDMGTFLHRTAGQLPMPNTGQQNARDRSEAMGLWPDCTWLDSWGTAGEITTYDANGTRTLIEVDMSEAYAPTKCSKAWRRWTWWKDRGWVLVQDRVVVAKQDLTVKSLIHCIEQPSFINNPSTILGSWSRGGVFTTSTDQRIKIDHGTSTARVYVCGASGGDTPSLRIIGGPSSSNVYWRQKQVPTDYGYVSDPAALSYEFYVEQTGENYMPSNPDGIDDDYVINRWRPPDLAGDWRVEITVGNPSDTVDIAYLVQVAPLGAPEASVNWVRDGHTLSVTAVAPPLMDTLAVVVGLPGTKYEELSRP